ncbi:MULTISPECIES: heavy metal sensor histidine kinase [unclassified Paraburkholderia]|uniref:heavy metal sensor histidine kinase n=1 Tax=unclassified Paraburkholderia TaxID=2615204 RepID=UPI002AB7C746|nr:MULTISPECIES: heavy metal sensor histidine kinase [unclassified Paraburkholderia]
MSAETRAYSLLRRLSFAFTAVAIVVLSLAGGLLYHALSRDLRRHDDNEITVKLRELLIEAHGFGSTSAVARMSDLFRDEMRSHPAMTFAILDSQGDVLADSGRPLQHLTSPGPGAPGQGEPWSCSPPSIGAARCVYGDSVLPSGEKIRVLLSHGASERNDLLGQYQGDVWGVLLAGSVLMGLLGYLIARRGLRPVKTIGRRISRIETHNLGERLDIDGGPVELRDIAVPVNRMLDRLERAFARLSQFSSDLAHDMRTPLANIISASQVTLSRERTIEEYETLIDSNIEECERLQRMIETMLFLARAEHAKESLRLSDLDCETEFARLTSFFEGVADNKGVRFVAQGAQSVRADPTLFLRALSNLVSNALNYAEPGSEVALRTYRSGDCIAVAVTNVGPGIAPEHIGKIFDRFYRINAARKGSAKNMGLGLAIVKSIMEQHRGAVDVVSRGGITTFTLLFPVLSHH